MAVTTSAQQAKNAIKAIEKTYPGKIPVPREDKEKLKTDFLETCGRHGGTKLHLVNTTATFTSPTGHETVYDITVCWFKGDGKTDTYAILIYDAAHGQYGFAESSHRKWPAWMTEEIRRSIKKVPVAANTVTLH